MLSPESVVELSIVGNPNAEDDPGVFEAIKHPTGYRRMVITCTRQTSDVSSVFGGAVVAMLKDEHPAIRTVDAKTYGNDGDAWVITIDVEEGHRFADVEELRTAMTWTFATARTIGNALKDRKEAADMFRSYAEGKGRPSDVNGPMSSTR